MREQAVQGLAMLRGGVEPAAALHADHQRHLGLAAQHVAQLGRLVHDLIEAHAGEIAEHQFRDGPHAGDRGAGRGADIGGFADRGVDHAAGAELPQQSFGDAHHAAPGILLAVAARSSGNILSDQKDIGIAAHFLAQSLVDRLAE